jgi:hypothetical protein
MTKIKTKIYIFFNFFLLIIFFFPYFGGDHGPPRSPPPNVIAGVPYKSKPTTVKEVATAFLILGIVFQLQFFLVYPISYNEIIFLSHKNVFLRRQKYLLTITN